MKFNGYVTSINMCMRFTILVYILLLQKWSNKKYIFLLLYHQNSFIQIHLNLIKISFTCFSNIFICLHFLLLNNVTWNQWNHIFNTHLLSHHTSLQMPLFHNTSHAIYSFYWKLLICFSIFCFLSNLHLTKILKIFLIFGSFSILSSLTKR